MRAEQLHMHVDRLDTELDESLPRRKRHELGPADEDFVVRRHVEHCSSELTDLFGRNAAVEQRSLLLLATEHVDDLQPPEIAVLQVLESLAKDDRSQAPIAVDECERGVRLSTEHRANQ